MFGRRALTFYFENRLLHPHVYRQPGEHYPYRPRSWGGLRSWSGAAAGCGSVVTARRWRHGAAVAAFGRGGTAVVGSAFGAVAVPVTVAWGCGVRAAVSALVVPHLALGAVERGLRLLAVGSLGGRRGVAGAVLRECAKGEEGEGCRRHGGEDDIGLHGFTVLMG